MSNDSTKAMQEALEAAVARMNAQASPPSPAALPSDPMSLIASLLPKLMNGNQQQEEEKEDLLERLETLQKEELAPLRVEVQTLSKQLHRVLKVQERILMQLQALAEDQGAARHAVLDLAEQMARVEILEELPPELGEEAARMTPPAPPKAAHRPRSSYPGEDARPRQRPLDR